MSEDNSLDIKEEMLNKLKISIWLDTYDDIFSDFDSRPYVDRTLSDDFISEAKKMAREKASGRIELNLLMPADLRDAETEKVVKTSLQKHFNNFADQIRKERISVRGKGFLLSLSGTMLMILTAYIDNAAFLGNSFLHNALHTLMEPAGWFLVWTGLDHIFSDTRTRKKEFDFNLNMANAEITFLSL